MHINNPDALKNWLTKILEPLCDADPPALSRYVLALLKKDKPIKELSQCMAEQLDVFLGVETKSFLERLFHVIKSEEYLKSADPLVNIVGSTTAGPVALDKVIETSNVIAIEKDTHENTPPLVEGKAKEVVINKKINDEHLPSKLGLGLIPLQPNSQTAVVSPTCKSHEPSPVKDKLEKESSNVRDVRRRRISLRSRSRSRSRSYERSRRSRSRERRINDREKNNRQFRNKSPPPPSNRDRYIRRAERSPRSYGRIRHRSNSASRSRSGSPDRRKVSRSMSPTNEDAPPIKRMRCRDFDEKGYCMRGETCPWDHGIDPVVLEDLNNSSLITSIQTSGNSNHTLRGAPLHSEYNPDAPDLWTRGGNFAGPRANVPHRTGANTGTYPRGPGANFRGIPPFPFPVNPAATTPLQRELIPVPVVDGNSNNVNNMGPGMPDGMSSQVKRRYEPEDTVAIAEAPSRRKIPINNRLGPRPQQNCSLELRKVPRGLNSIAHLNNHFSKFGKIVNIQISYDGDPEAAIITFSSHAEANVAYRSTEAVLNNRFIKVFWHTPGANSNSGETALNNIAPTIKDEVPSRRIFTSQHTLSNIPATPVATTTDNANSDTSKSMSLVNSTASVATGASTTNSTTITTANSVINTATLPQTAAQIRLKNSRITRATNELIRKKQEEQVKNAVQIAHGLHKRKHDLLQEYIKQMRSALELVDRVEHSDPKRPKLLSTIKELQASIDKLRKEITAEQAQMAAQISQSNPAPMKKSKEQQQKELLDVELELITQQQEGNDTTAIQKRLQELQRSYGTTTNRPHFPRVQRVRPAPPGSTSVDRRPTTITIVGFSLEESDLLLGHFKHFGEITKNQLDKTVPSLTISYATRSSAEQAMSRGRTFKEKRLQLTWLLPSIAAQPKNENINTENIENSEPSTAELTLEDEEEEEDAESEDRSWRR